MTAPADPLADGWRRAAPAATDYRADAWIALLLTAGTALSITLTRTAGILNESPWWLAALWVAAIALPLAARRRFPEAVAITVAVVFATGATLGATDTLFSGICLYVAIYSAGAWGVRRAVSRWVRLGIVSGMFLWLFWNLITQANQTAVLPDLSRAGIFSPYAAYGLLQVLINLLYFGAAYFFGDAAWQSARNRAALETRTTELAAERERSAAQAVALERVRIARELHDVVAHHVSVMGIQAGAARRILNSDPVAAARALTVVETSARAAVDELHSLLGTLRADDHGHRDDDDDHGDDPDNKVNHDRYNDDTDDRGPTHDRATPAASRSASTRGIAALGELADESRRSGVPVRLLTVGYPREVSGLIGLSIYRITQEALTNTRKHAGPGAAAEVRLRYLADAVELEITDNGVGPTLAYAPGQGGSNPGLGLRGMSERVAAVNGDLQTGGRSRGGYLVRARFPLAPTPGPAGS
jgi:signal transduction histidine kinase